jgi:hypothetical protein
VDGVFAMVKSFLLLKFVAIVLMKTVMAQQTTVAVETVSEKPVNFAMKEHPIATPYTTRVKLTARAGFLRFVETGLRKAVKFVIMALTTVI